MITMTNNEILKNNRGKSVKCIETGIIYKNIHDAAIEHNCHYTLISMNCRGKCKTAKGMHFEFVNKPDIVINVNNDSSNIELKRNITIQKEATFEANGMRDNGNCKAIYCITDGMPFASMVDAAEYYGIGKSAISYACSEKGRTAGGKQFCKFKDLYLYIHEINDAINKKNEYMALIEKENKRKELENNINKHEENIRSIEVMLIEAKQALEYAKTELENFNN